MKPRRKILLTLLGFTGVILVLWLFLFREPTYHGLALSRWVKQLNEGDAAEQREASAAIRAMGKRAVPFLRASLDRTDSPMHQWVVDAGLYLPAVKAHFLSAEIERGYAAQALGEIGPPAADAIPALIAASRDTNSFRAPRASAALIKIRQESIAAYLDALRQTGNLSNWLENAQILLCLGSNVQSSAQPMINALEQAGLVRRFAIVEELGGASRQPEAAVLLLTAMLKDPEPGIRANTLNDLMRHASLAKSAVTAIQQATLDSNQDVRFNANFALQYVFHQPATNH